MKKFITLIFICISLLASGRQKTPVFRDVNLNNQEYVVICDASTYTSPGKIYGGVSGYYLESKTDNQNEKTYIRLWLGSNKDEAAFTISKLQTFKTPVYVKAFKTPEGESINAAYDEEYKSLYIEKDDIVGKVWIYGSKKWWEKIFNNITYTNIIP